MNNDLISRSALKESLHNEIGEHALSIAIDRVIDNAPTVETYKEKYEELKEAYRLLSEAYEYEVTKKGGAK